MYIICIPTMYKYVTPKLSSAPLVAQLVESLSLTQRAGTLKIDNRLPNLVNLNEDPQLSEMLLYVLKDGKLPSFQLHVCINTVALDVTAMLMPYACLCSMDTVLTQC